MELLPVGLYSIDQRSKSQEEHAKSIEDKGKEKDYKEVAKEMESLFAYEFIKVMRKTADSISSEKKEQGYDTYMSLFDMELSKLFAEKGFGLQDTIERWMTRMEGMNDANNE